MDYRKSEWSVYEEQRCELYARSSVTSSTLIFMNNILVAYCCNTATKINNIS